jgi:hypothetical protein
VGLVHPAPDRSSARNNSEQIRQISQKTVLKSSQKSTVLLFKKSGFAFLYFLAGAAKPKQAFMKSTYE